MSGIRNLANILANDPKGDVGGLISKSEAAKFVPQTGGRSGKKSHETKIGKPGKSGGKY